MEEEPAITTRVGRVVVPSTRAREALEGADSTDPIAATRKMTSKAKPTAVRKAASQIEERQCAQDENQVMLRKMCQYLKGTYQEVKSLQEMLSKQEKIIQEQNNMIKGLQAQIEVIQNQSTEDCRQFWEQLDTIAKVLINAASMQSKSQPSFANITNSQSGYQHSTHLGPLGPLVPPTLANTLFCTIDTSRVREEDKPKAQIANIRQMIEKEIQGNEGMEIWCCVATAILDMNSNVLLGVAEALGKENNVDIAKITWLSKRDSNKVYGSIVVYITKGTDAKRLLEGNYFDIAGESAYT
ncbi:hypothetical protein TSTA_014190 [Talaromyces stipitatus ATCC 10500]|uniref:Uncharacterized protein n=1 Tax=Talaromyces stipitatus (strain ATCC 10500 / CBS 375.48 / QM 6759 / NRRL 1006) TaxID=441959 RepID=B8MGU2_TALSN|nr:uncharacterized protein TSTA_014190 [Talaromyces stipitatus ATCC 10500]EED16323.1 hypothetical protein TSTA_014190 [Talaromyces stipitatus ATCC 10500]